MSQFSGKCDLYDSVVMIGGYDVKNIELFLYKNGKNYPLKLETEKDLIPYYPYVPFLSTGSKDGKYRAYLSESFIDVEEKKILTFQLKDLLREYRKCKRKKIPFKPNISWYNKALIEKVEKDGEKATANGIHLNMQNYFRKRLAEEMETNGYSDIEIIKWVYPDKIFTDNWDWRKDNY